MGFGVSGSPNEPFGVRFDPDTGELQPKNGDFGVFSPITRVCTQKIVIWDFEKIEDLTQYPPPPIF